MSAAIPQSSHTQLIFTYIYTFIADSRTQGSTLNRYFHLGPDIFFLQLFLPVCAAAAGGRELAFEILDGVLQRQPPPHLGPAVRCRVNVQSSSLD